MTAPASSPWVTASTRFAKGGVRRGADLYIAGSRGGAKELRSPARHGAFRSRLPETDRAATVRAMIRPELFRTPWRTSSHSANQGGECVRVATVWRTSSRSGEQGGDCVQVAVVPAGRTA